MATLQELVKRHLDETGKSVRSLAQETGLGYQILLGVVNRGSIPRKPDHREALRTLLEIDERSWSDILTESSGDTPSSGSIEGLPTLQQLVLREMYAHSLTEQDLAKRTGVAYSTVMGITRKGSIPREDSLRRLADALELDFAIVQDAVASSKAVRRNPDLHAARDDEEEDDRNLAQMVADHIQSRGQSMGAFARDLGVGYLTLSRCLETGHPPSEPKVLESLRRMLDIDTGRFTAALQRSREDPQPAEFAERDELLGADASELQRALVEYMRDKDLTLKALAKRAGLSQVTVSRLVKQGQSPTRATTHLKLQELLDLPPEQYQALVESRKAAAAAGTTSTPALRHKHEPEEEAELEDHYLPQEVIDELPFDLDNPPDKDELVALVKKLGPKQRAALRSFLATLV